MRPSPSRSHVGSFPHLLSHHTPPAPNGIAVAGVAEFEVSTFLKSDKVTLKESDCDEGFKKSFSQHVMCENQELALQQGGVLVRYRMIRILPLQLGDGKVQPGKVSKALLTAQTEFSFVANESSSNIQIQPKKPVQRHIFRPDFNFEELGIGGLDKEFADIFRRAFASRIFPANVIQELGIHHVRGMLLYGPPGTGKTLIARQIGKALQARPPKLVNGPEILNKFVGQSEENIRNLFKEAEDEQKKKGDNSQLHIIIFDEIDAICKQRGTTSSGTGVNDSIVNQLLSKIDGVDSLNNILLIGMTNRLDMLDEAILRPGRFLIYIHKKCGKLEGLETMCQFRSLHLKRKTFLGLKLRVSLGALHRGPLTGTLMLKTSKSR
eukprot:GHVN01044367.1.p1 GENE.GHVN01044367.1~~GHVN01044367.1.p1  ORF type:complete len:379 (+),score=39.17 GHVN01044367.1:306-1442(+)